MFTLNKVEILFNSLIRPISEYGSPAWNPWYTKDITRLEKVQRMCYKICNSPEVYKYIHDMCKTDKNLFFTQSQRTLRGNSLKLVKPYARTLIRSNFLHRVVNSWNSLPEAVVSSPSLDAYKDTLRTLPLGLGIIHPSNPSNPSKKQQARLWRTLCILHFRLIWTWHHDQHRKPHVTFVLTPLLHWSIWSASP